MSVAAGRAIVRKMHGTRNSFLVLDERPPKFDDYPALARRLCARDAFAVDGLLVVREAPRESASIASMLVINADGSEAEMCGNGVRCVARYLAERGAGDAFSVATAAGDIALAIVEREPEFLVRASLVEPQFDDARPIRIDAAGRTWDVHRVSTGNPHAVIFVDDVDAVDLDALGVSLNAHDRFPEGVNVHVARRIDANALAVRHYERGVGQTQACGTGAVASAAAAIRAGLVASPVAVHVPGGTLTIVLRPGEPVTMTGPAENVFEREIAP
jgi:diaminopimelate epimerase